MNKILGADCTNCPLRGCTFVPPNIKPDSDIVIIGEAPGATEAMRGLPFVGESGRLLRGVLGGASEQVSYTNVVMCKPPNNVMQEGAIAACKGHLETELAGKNLLAVGQIAQNAVMPTDATRGAMYERGDGTYCTATYHPAAVLRNPELYWEFYDNVTMFMRGVVRVALPNTELNKIPSPLCNTALIVDIETVSVSSTEILLIGLLPITGDVAYMLTEKESIAEFVRLANTGAWPLVFHNAPFDVEVLHAWGLDVNLPYDDTLVMHLMLREKPPHGLEDLARLVFGMDNYKDMLDAYKPNRVGYDKVPIELLIQYNAMDLEVTRMLYHAMIKVLDRPLYKHAIALQHAIVKMQLHGIPIDPNVLEVARNEMRNTIDTCAAEMHNILLAALKNKPKSFASKIWSKPIQQLLNGQTCLNPGSSVQMSWFLYDVLSFPRPQKALTSTGAAGTGKEAIAELCNTYNDLTVHPAIVMLKEYRRVAKLLSGYVDVMLKYGNVIHADFLIHGTEIGRLSTRNPTIHGIPRADDYYGNFIRASVTRPGSKIIVADYAQIELRVAAMLSGEPVWVDAFREGRDPHGAVARDLFGEGYTKTMRVWCKNFNFAFLYGGNEYSFASQVNLPLERAAEFVRQYSEKMSRLIEWKLEVEELALSLGYVENPFGRRRRFPYVNRNNISDVRKQALHFLVSSTASELCTRALTRLIADNRLNVIASVHDSIIGAEPTELADEYGEVYGDVMRSVAYEYFPDFWWGVDVEVANRWSPYPVIVTKEQAEQLGFSGKPPFCYVVPQEVPSFLGAYCSEDLVNLWLPKEK